MVSKVTFVATAVVILLHLSSQTAFGIPLSEFYPFGVDAGDFVLDRTLDGSSPLIQLNYSVFPFYGQEYAQLYVNANGHISFLNPISQFVPEIFPLQEALPLIAPFWADSDTRPDDGGQIWYRESSDSTILSKLKEIINSKFLAVKSFTPKSIIIVTWDHIGYYLRHTDKNNTFQCVLVTDGKLSFVMFLYADGLIQWLWSDDHVGNPAEVGINAGDGIRFFRHPDSNTTRLLNITLTTNVGTPGVWVVRTDKEGLPIEGCKKGENVPITLVPRSGNMLGGTGVIVSGPCFGAKSKCKFDEAEVTGVPLNDTLLLCVTPAMKQPGEVLVTVVTLNNPYYSTFFAVSPERAHSIDVIPGGLLFNGDESRVISWSPDTIAPPQFFPNATDIRIDITLFHQNFQSKSPNYIWEGMFLVTNMSNNGSAAVKIPSVDINCEYPTNGNLKLSVCPAAIKVSLNFADPNPATDLGQWSGVGFLKTKNLPDMKLREGCDDWIKSNRDQTSSRITNLVPCPPTLRLARFDPVYREVELTSNSVQNSRYPQNAMSFFHPDAHVCFNEAVPQSSVGQECCYDVDGNLVIGPPGGGSADAMSPRVDYNGHVLMDLAPYVLCCTGNAANCEAYYSERPSGTEDDYRLPIPACIYGDPHIVTLDGFKYTFNGKGEFTLIETEDATFTLQGRMEPATTANGIDAPGTVFTAIVAIQHQTNTHVQFEIRSTGVKVKLGDEFIDFSEMKEIKFSEVTLEDRGNATVTAAFSEGTSIELKVENGIISVMLVSLPSYQKGKTRGLMGNFNGDPNDDLVPKDATTPIPPDSSMEAIHYMFGITWIIENPAESSFSYNPGDSHSKFFDPMFEPVFEPNFNDSLLEDEAVKICGDDRFCLFDIAATKRKEIGATTLLDSENFEVMVANSKPIVCNPQCVNGACVENNTCACSQGFSGDRCKVPIMSDCEENFCQNNGTCIKHVLTVTCLCEPGYVGAFCQDKEPPFHIQLINSSPRVGHNLLIIDFIPSKPIAWAKCHLSGQGQKDCTSGHVTFEGIPAATYIFRVVAKNLVRERAVIRRRVKVIGDDDSGSASGDGLDIILCAVNLINEGIVVKGNNVTAQFVGVGSATSHLCRVDSQLFRKCRSPMTYQHLTVGIHRIQIQPQGLGCDRKSRLSMKFQVS